MTNAWLRDEIEIELSNLTRTVEEVEALLVIMETKQATTVDRAAAALFLSQYYNGIENIMKRICRASNFKMPVGENSHVELFALFCEDANSGLPILFPAMIRQGYIELRRFRHFVHHGYAFQLDWERLSKGLSTLRFLFEGFRERALKYLDEELL